MEASSNLVIKVKYGNMLRRFNSPVVDGELKLNADGLRQKIISLFNLDTNAELVLTYVDEDGDVVTLVDDDDIRDAVKQDLNPLRITAKSSSAKNSKQDACSTGSSTPLRSPRVKPPVQNTDTGVSGPLRDLPEPVREMLVQISTSLASKASGSSSSTLSAAELVDYYTKLGLSYLDKHLESRSGVRPIVTDAAETEGSVLNKDGPANTDGNTTVSELLKDLPESLQKTFMTFNSTWATLASSVFSSAPGSTDLEDYYKKLGLFFLEQNLISQNEAESSTSSDINPVKDSSIVTKNPKLSNGDHPALKEVSNLRTELSSIGAEATDKVKRLNHIAGTLLPGDCTSPNPVPAPVQSVLGVPITADEGKAKKVVEFYPNVNSQQPSQHGPSNAGKVDGSCIASSGMPSIINTTTTGNKVDLNEPGLGGSDPKSGKGVDVGGTSVSLNEFGKSPVSTWAPRHTKESQFSGIAMGMVPAAPPLPASIPIPFRRSISQNENRPNVFHHGVRCDGCGVHPIAGPRYKSKVMADYDLCSTCFAATGNKSNYIRMDFPMPYRSRLSFKGFPGPHRRPNLPLVYRGCKAKVAPKLDSRFVLDVNVLDGTVIPPSTPFTKIWRMKNSGMVGWPQGTHLVWIGGDKLSNTLSVELEIPASTMLPEQELDVAVDFISPDLPGRYISYWKMSAPSGQKFGQRVWVLIQVENSINVAPLENIRNLNLNLPPVSSSPGPEIINVNPEPTGVYNHAKPDNLKKVEEMVQPNADPELKFPINDSLLVGNGASSSSGPSVSHPIIDLSDVPPLVCPLPPPMVPTAPVVSQVQPESVVDVENKLVEEKLLQELNEMGFKQLDLNKEVLRINEYDIEQSVADLCDVTEWDPMLEELEEMGFNDRETNKQLLMKNNGSIKRVVMDLIADEMHQ